ncbi:MAG: ABC transporter substrate-binding protein [Acidobacteria bacterium]|nr:ABC transporter substrate-binding protein [Acidobacteriota bacterium]
MRHITLHMSSLRRWFSAALIIALCVPFTVHAHAQQAQRIISLVPALTEMLFAIGAGAQVVAVSSYDEDPPDVRTLPRVGALLDPDTERILSLKPTLVITYGSQTDLQAQLKRAGIALFDYRHGGLADVTATMRALGERTGRTEEADTAARSIEAQLAAVRARTAPLHKPRTMLVFGRERGSLRNIYVSGGRGFLHDMLVAAGGVNVFADVDREAVQASTELILSRAPDVILEVRSADIGDAAAARREAESWSTLASVPAVRQKRVIVLTGKGLTVPGPRVGDVVERIARALHP